MQLWPRERVLCVGKIMRLEKKGQLLKGVQVVGSSQGEVQHSAVDGIRYGIELITQQQQQPQQSPVASFTARYT